MTALPDFVELADLEAYLAGDQDAMVRQAQAAIRRYCGWHVAPSLTETLTLDGTGSRHLWLPSLHVIDVTAASNDGEDVALDDLDWSEAGYLELRCGHWCRRPRSIEVTLEHGFEEGPDDLVEVAAAIAARAISSPSGATREQAGQVSFQWGTVAPGVAGSVALLQHERDILDHYKLPPRA